MDETEGGAALATIPEEERDLRGLELAERHFPMERREQIAAFLEVPADNPAMLPYLAWCAGNGFSPIAGHVWLIPRKIKGKDGGEERTVYKPAVGRDGLLHRARSTRGKGPGSFKGMKFGVVCERDTFEFEDGTHLDAPRILHRFASKPTVFEEGEAPDRYRGTVIGAWAICYIDGEPPTAYYAPLREHGRLRQVWAWNPDANGRRPLFFTADGERHTFAPRAEDGTPHRPVQEWDGAWDYLSTMILKAAQSYVLRIGLGITGVVPVDELRDTNAWSEGRDRGESQPAFVEPPTNVIDLAELLPDADSEVRDRLQQAVDTANEQEPFSWGAAKCEMVFTGRSEDELRGFVEQIERENDLREQHRQQAAEEGEPVDAVIVEESPELAALETQLELARRDLGAAEPGSEEETVMRAEVDRLEARVRDARGDSPTTD